jgi:hypothetical protein
MPTTSREDLSSGPITDLGLPGRAVSALARAGVTTVEELAVLTRRELAAINGLGPGTIASIRRAVPEPPAGAPRPAARPRAGQGDANGDANGDAAVEPAEDVADRESPAAPSIPSFDSLRGPRRRTPVDLLMPDQPPAPGPVPADAERPAPAARPGPAPPPRPAEYADLLRLGMRLVQAMAGAPVRIALWAAGEQVRCLRRLLGAEAPRG